jgi:hypothetical protein
MLFDLRLHRVLLLAQRIQLFAPRGAGVCILRIRGCGFGRCSRGLCAKSIQLRVQALDFRARLLQHLLCLAQCFIQLIELGLNSGHTLLVSGVCIVSHGRQRRHNQTKG